MLNDRLLSTLVFCKYHIIGLITCVCVLVACVLANVESNRSALWHIVNDKCVANQNSNNNPAPCEYVSLDKNYAVLKDRNGSTQFLVIPTIRVSGIESLYIMADDAPNYWQAAWEARKYVFKRAGHELPADTISMAINSPFGRTQDQLHIHIDCLKAEVRNTIRANMDQIHDSWSLFPVALAGHNYQAMRITPENLGNINLFRVLAKTSPDMSRETLVVAGAIFPDGAKGFVLLSDRANPITGDRASGEELQDHECKLAASI